MVKKDNLLFVTCLIFIASLQVSKESPIKFEDDSKNDVAPINPSASFEQDKKSEVNNSPSSHKEETNSEDGTDTRSFYGGRSPWHRRQPSVSSGHYYGGSSSYYGGSYYNSRGRPYYG